MSPPGSLPKHLYDAALSVSDAVSEHKGFSSILIGGAALMAHRMDSRFTKVRINLSLITGVLMSILTRTLISTFLDLIHDFSKVSWTTTLLLDQRT